MSLRQWVSGFILVQACTLAQCSVDHSIIGRCLTTCVLMCQERRPYPLISQEWDFTFTDLYSTGGSSALLPVGGVVLLTSSIGSCAVVILV
jgi:hypothetical protein